MQFVVVAPTGFMPHFLYSYDEWGPRFLTRLDLAKRFPTRDAAQKAANAINAKYPDPIHPCTVQPIKEKL